MKTMASAPLLTTMAVLAITCLLLAALADAESDRVFPQRTSSEAAVVEWGHSAIISALDGAVATFGPQTSQGASFEVETAPVLANPIDGVGSRKTDGTKDMEMPELLNADEVEGNMLIMTDAAGLSGVAMARIAKISGAAALMVVNSDQDAGDYIYSLEPENAEEAEYAEKHIDIPVIMVSLQAGNVITTAMATTDTKPEIVNRGGALPDRVRLYAGGDRPFFEDAVSKAPVVYLIHNMLNKEECADLIGMANGKYDLVDDTTGIDNYLENTMASEKPGPTANNIERATIWKGGIAGKLIKDIDERISQVTGFPPEHFSDFQINKFTEGSFHDGHYDINPANGIMASINIFLNDVSEDQGGDFIFTHPEDGGRVVIKPTKGLAIVHHNTDEEYNFDKSTRHFEATLKGGYKYVAKKFVYLNPQPNHMRIVLPLMALPFGGKLPRVFVTLHNILIDKYGFETADVYFGKIVTMIPVLLLIIIANMLTHYVTNKLKNDGGAKKEKEEADGKSKKSKSKSKKSD